MTTPELLEFIRIEHALGMSLSEITHLLISEGEWDIADVAEAFRTLGLPEEAVESFSINQKNEDFKQIISHAKPAEKKDEIIHHAPAPTGATSPKNVEYQRRAAPMHYVEKPVEPIKPTLARPASLSGQVSRNLVRTVSTAASYAKVEGPKGSLLDHNGASIHISKLSKDASTNRDIAGPANTMGAPLPKPKEVSGALHDIENALSIGLDMHKEEPKPKTVATPFHNLSEDKTENASPIHISSGGEVKEKIEKVEEIKVADINKINTPIPEIKSMPIPPVDLPISEEVSPEKNKEEIKVEDTKKEEVKVEEIKKEEIKSIPEFTPPPITQPKIEEPIVSVAPAEKVAPIVVPKEAPIVQPPIPASLPQQPAQFQPAQFEPPQYAPQQIPQIIMQQPQQYYTQPEAGSPVAPSTPQPKSMISNEPTMAEIGSVSTDVEEKAYLAQFGQGPMPKEIQRPQPTYSPTIIYAQQVITQAPSPVENRNAEPEVKKPEPLRFDIGKIRTAHKTDQSSYSGRPSVISAVDGMEPVKSKTMEELFNEKLSIKPEDVLMSAEKKETIHSLKVPHKRTMMSDLVNVQVGGLPGQVVSQSVKEGEVGSVSSNVVTIIDEEPVPPPPPKKSSKTMFLIVSLVAFFIIIGAAAGYYFVVLRLPSGGEVYNTSLGVALRGPVISYETNLLINGTSTTAEPEYLNVNIFASGTLAVNSKSFENGFHYADISIDHIGVDLPVNLRYQGNIIVNDDQVYISQNFPTLGTPIENLLMEGEWIKAPYSNIGSLAGLTDPNAVSAGEYQNITQSTSLFKMFITNSPLVVGDDLQKSIEDGREIYKVPLTINSKKAVIIGDLLSKYLRGANTSLTSAERAKILEARYDEISGYLIVDKLSMKPIKISLEGKFDSNKMPMEGSVKFDINFNILNQITLPQIKAKTLDEIKAQRLTESLSASIIAKDSPVKAVVPVVNLALSQYHEKFGRFPIELTDLFNSGFLGKDSISADVMSKIFYSSYVEKPEGISTGNRCTAKNIKCGFYHFGANVEFKKSSELDNDSDFQSSVIDGSDDYGCHKEANYACLDYIIDYSNPVN